MSKKIITRILIWTLLILGLIVITYYTRQLFVISVKEDIAKQEKFAQTIQSNITLKNNQIKTDSSLQYDNNFISYMIPNGYDEKDIIEKYINRPVFISDADIVTFSVNDGLPSELTLSKNISGVKVSLTMNVSDISQFNTFVDELYNGVRLVYFGNFSYNLPGESALNSNAPITIKITCDYYLFYTTN